MGKLTAPRALLASDDRSAFDCGRESLNGWFLRHGWRNHLTGVSRVTVICDAASGVVAAYAALCAGHIERAALPKPAQRNKPDPFPIILLGQLAVDVRYQGKGCGRSLMRAALATTLRVSQEIGCAGVLTHPLDDGVRAFYRQFGFIDLRTEPGRAMLLRMAELSRSGLA